MAKLSIQAAPTFRAKVEIPVAGSKPVAVEFTFKHRTKSELDKLLAKKDVKDIETVMDILTGWEFEEPFERENVEIFLDNFGGAALALFGAYVDELLAAKRKN